MKKKIVLPLKFIKTIDNNVVLAVKAKIKDVEGFFIVDTGAQVSVISDNLKEYSYEELFDVDKIVSVTEESVQNVKLIKLYDVKFGRYKLDLGLTFIFNLNHIQENIKQKYLIVGLLGLTFLKEFKTKIDLKNKKMVLHYNR